MDNSFTNKIDELIAVWTNAGIQINKGITADEIASCEKALNFTFDEDFWLYLTKLNGFEDFDSDKAWFSFWSVDRIRKEYGDCHPLELVCFADHSINLCSYGFHKTDKKVYIHFQTIEGIEVVADTFTEFINTYSVDPYNLLR